ncbi:hypothetical protein [Streptomyces pinistramenti]|uniref:hypothetical protein n=1 Tax=Streptomyces pinistramenti TaxID=2884812 RepID=UPI001D085228|nr:hypothetical protein [Streptomyces pinistramenti]MCB5908928.1 hypothetical protein [Streptomyces pinistramenti]
MTTPAKAQDPLTAGVAARSGTPLTYEQAAARLRKGGDAYWRMLDRGHHGVLEALEALRGRAARPAERAHLDEALRDVHRHDVPEWIIRPVNAYWAERYQAECDAAEDAPDGGALRAGVYHAVSSVHEYLWPGCQDEYLACMR